MGYLFKKVVCNICGVDDTEYVGKRAPSAYNIPEDLKADIVRCKRCGLMYPNPMPFADNEQLQKNYSKPESYFPSAITDDRIKFYESIIKGLDKYSKKGRLLDVGCGRGELLYSAKKYGWGVLGIDVSEDFVSYAKSRFDVPVIVGNLKDSVLQREKFDAITLVSVLQHSYDPADLLINANRVLKDGGVLFIEVMNNGSLIYKAGDIYYRLTGSNKTTNLSPTFPSYQIYGFSKASILKMLEKSGFKILYIKIKGGISRTERSSAVNFKSRMLELFRKLIMLIAQLFNNGQVINVYAIKERSL